MRKIRLNPELHKEESLKFSATVTRLLPKSSKCYSYSMAKLLCKLNVAWFCWWLDGGTQTCIKKSPLLLGYYFWKLRNSFWNNCILSSTTTRVDSIKRNCKIWIRVGQQKKEKFLHSFKSWKLTKLLLSQKLKPTFFPTLQATSSS